MKDLKALEDRRRKTKSGMRLRVILAVIWQIVFLRLMGHISYTSNQTEMLLIINPLLMAGGWFAVGGRKFVKAGTGSDADDHRAVKITILHSILLIMAIISIALEAEVLTSWEIVYWQSANGLGSMQDTALQIFMIFIVICIITMVISMYGYRCFSMEYYSVICHSIGFICTLLSYISIIRNLDELGYPSQMLLKYNWIYGQSLALASAFLIYCSHERRKHRKKATY